MYENDDYQRRVDRSDLATYRSYVPFFHENWKGTLFKLCNIGKVVIEYTLRLLPLE